ncbi:MAG TPA: RHS repeat-associated core domain-containing protein, partial [Pseudonocardiaceae bacterium]|nr:RHS repeat-associated core domain-containing protein [Pseudonocardiaceae bacterium]
PQTTFTDGRGLTTAIYQYHAGATPSPTDPASNYDKTSYAYTPAKKLTAITDAAGNKWSYTYSLLGNQLTSTAPDSGTTTSTYDSVGQLMSVTDARGKQVSYTYDANGRKTAEYDTTGGALESTATQLASWTWDTLAEGKLTSSTAYEGAASYTEQITGYNTQELPSATATIIPMAQGALAGTYTTSYTYAPGGQQTSYTDSAAGGLPQETVATGYDNAGEPDSLTGANGYADTLSYTNLGQPLQYTLGTASEPAYITDSYDPQTSRLTEQDIQTTTAKTSVDDQHYTYDNVGNVTSEADTPAGDSSATDVQCFQYDYLDRLAQAWAQGSTGCAATPSASAEGGTAPYWDSYSFNIIGNLTGITTTTAAGAVTTTTHTYPVAGAVRPHGITGRSVTTSSGTTSTSYSYDASGNLNAVTGASSQALNWNDAGQLTQDAVTPSGSTAESTSYTYDANGTLLITADPGTTTLYLPDEEITLSGGTVTGTRYYTLDGTAIAARTGASNVCYLAGDQHGTDTLTIDSATLGLSHRYYDPFGNPRGTVPISFPSGEKGFVGGIDDTTTGLTDLGIREYLSATGSFVSVDPILKPYDPRDLNPYAYANGNPATDSDPSGAMASELGGYDGCAVYSGVEFQNCQSQVDQVNGDSGQNAPRGATETSPPCYPGWCPELCGQDLACIASRPWVQDVLKWAKQAGVDPKLVLALVMTEMSGRCNGSCVLQNAENRLAAAFSFTPWYKASIGLGNMKPDTWQVLQHAYPQLFSRIRWSSLVGNANLDIEAIAYYVKYIQQDVMPKVAGFVKANSTPNQIVAGIYNLGIPQFFKYVNSNVATPWDPWGNEGSYINEVMMFMTVAQVSICAWSTSCSYQEV